MLAMLTTPTTPTTLTTPTTPFMTSVPLKPSIHDAFTSFFRRAAHTLLTSVLRNTPHKAPFDAAFTGSVRKILVLRHDKLGDMIVTLPALTLLREHFPSSSAEKVSEKVSEKMNEKMNTVELHVLASPTNAGVLCPRFHENQHTNQHAIQHLDKRVDKLFIWDGTLKALPRLAWELRRERYDMVLCFVLYKMTNKGLLVNVLVGSKPRKITLAHPTDNSALQGASRDRYQAFFNTFIATPPEQPMVRLLAHFVCTLTGTDPATRLPSDAALQPLFHIPLSDEHRSRARAWFDGIAASTEKFKREKIILLNLSAGMPFRQWSFERNSACIQGLRALADRTNERFLIVLNAAPSERAQAERLCALSFHASGGSYASEKLSYDASTRTNSSSSTNVVALPATRDVLDLCAAVELADVVITPDTSVTHIATACGKPSVVLYTTISLSPQWMPVGVAHRVLCAPATEPIEAITAEQVVAAFAELLVEISADSSVDGQAILP
jgi:ADP-heptose:LPS heptosyltransferase